MSVNGMFIAGELNATYKFNTNVNILKSSFIKKYLENFLILGSKDHLVMKFG